MKEMTQYEAKINEHCNAIMRRVARGATLAEAIASARRNPYMLDDAQMGKAERQAKRHMKNGDSLAWWE